MRRALIVIAALVIIALYLHGTFDRALSGVGLNYNECARNGLGATFCGNELDEYRARVERAKEGVETATRKAKEATANSERESEERRSSEHEEEEHKLEAKMSKERRLVETEPQGSFGYDLAHDEYESARAELNQLHTE
jgi:hypothetical protein